MITTDPITTTTWKRADHRLKFSFGGVLLHAVRFPAVTREAAFLADITADGLGICQPSLPDDVRAAIVYSQRAEQPLGRVQLQAHTVRYVRSQYRRFLIALNGTYVDYEKKFSPQRRRHFRQAVRRFAEASGGTIDWREYRRPSDMALFHSLAREVSQKTYQEKLTDAGLPDTDTFRQELAERAERDSVRGHILFLDQKPIAYQYCPASGTVITCERLGYDPEYRQHSPGLVLLLLTLERLFTEKRFDIFDFGKGEYSYKETMATSSVPCADIYYLRRTMSNLALVFCHATIEVCSTTLSSISERLGLRRKLKKVLRSHYGRK
jgi:CelD/BcsL family acetyltransferase involved in cellulose biosynthesis